MYPKPLLMKDPDCLVLLFAVGLFCVPVWRSTDRPEFYESNQKGVFQNQSEWHHFSIPIGPKVKVSFFLAHGQQFLIGQQHSQTKTTTSITSFNFLLPPFLGLIFGRLLIVPLPFSLVRPTIFSLLLWIIIIIISCLMCAPCFRGIAHTHHLKG